MVDRKTISKGEDKDGLQMMTALAIGLFFVVIGVPLWWKTTTTYRAYLPHSDIHELAHKELICHIPLVLVTCHQALPPNQLKVTEKLFEEFLNRDSSTAPHFTLKYSVSARNCAQRETAMLKSNTNVGDLAAKGLGLLNGQPSIDTQVYLVSESAWGSSQGNVYVGKHNSIYALAEISGVSPKNRLEDVAKILKKRILSEESLASAHITSIGVRLRKDDPDMMRAVQSTPGYEISFTLMNSDPSEVIARWNIDQAVQDYLQPFLEKLKVFADFSVSSQVLHYSELPLNPKKDKDGSHYYLSASALPLLINPVETKIGTDVSMYPTLNFLVYIPSMKYRPLHIHDKEGNKVDTNAFFSPRWGGIQVQNPPTSGENGTLPVEYEVNMKSAMEVYLSQLRLLIGVPDQRPSEDVMFASPGQAALTDWELQALLRKRAVENIATATSTLHSLSKLLEKIHNMVINDDIAAEVYSSAQSLRKAHDYLAEGELMKAFHLSKRSILSAEKAFFDPSLLELLYFPEDQKFAIYIPLFLPVGIPVVLSLFKALKWVKAKRKEKQS